MSSIFDILYIPMGYIIRFAYSLTNNYLFAILLFALVIEILCLPIQIKQQKNSIAQAKLQPKVRAITKKYDGRTDNASLQKKQQEVMDLYKKENFSPYGGCLPMLIQLPIIFALYHVIINPLRYIAGLSAESIKTLTGLLPEGVNPSQIGMIQHLRDTGIDAYVNEVPELSEIVLPNFTTLGIDLSVNPSFTQINWYWLIPILVFVGMMASTMILRKFTYQAPETAEAQNNTSMKVMNVAMPLMSAWISFSVPAAVGCYWIFRNIISVVERIIISKIMPVPKMTEEELRAAEREYGSKKKPQKSEKADKPKVRSLHRIDFDDEPLPPSKPEKESAPEVKEEAEGGLLGKAPLKEDKPKRK